MEDINSIPPLTRTFTTVVTGNGKLTISKHIREMLALKPGDAVTAYVTGHVRKNGRVVNIDHVPKASRTFTKKVLRDYKIAIPLPMKKLLNIDDGDYITLTILHVRRGGR